MARTATVAEVDSSATVVTLAAANRSRRNCNIYNESSAILYVKLGAAATTDDFTFKLAANTNLPYVLQGYTGIITGIWASANGSARVSQW